MLRKKASKNGLSKNFTKSRFHVLKPSLKAFPGNRHILKIKKLRSINFKWIFLLVSIYVGFGLILLFIQQFFDLIKNIIVYSLMGFFTFFMSYFGWRLAQNVREVVRREIRKEHVEYQAQ